MDAFISTVSTMVIDNFKVIRPRLDFADYYRSDGTKLGGSLDRYLVHVIKRAKDDGGKKFGSNESQRLIKTFEITSVEYFDGKESAIKELCRTNKARAYFLPQVRSSRDCILSLMRMAPDYLDVPGVKLSHMFRTAMHRTHASRKKMFVFDLDYDRYDSENVAEYLDEIKKLLRESGRDENDAYYVQTPNGCHIVSPAFDREEFHRRRPEALVEDILPDGMTLLFFDDGEG